MTNDLIGSPQTQQSAFPSFVKNTALQQYHPAEVGIFHAFQNGFSHWYIDLSIPTDRLITWDRFRIKEVKKRIEQYHVFPIIHGSFKSPLASDLNEMRCAAVEYTKKEIELASKLNAPLIVHAGSIVEPRLVNQAKKTALKGFLDSLGILVDCAQRKGVELWVENLSNYKRNHPFYYIFTHTEEFEYILTRCEYVKFFLDIGHANINNENVEEIIRLFHDRMVGISISNNNGSEDQHMNLYRGTIDYTRIIQILIHCGWSGFVGIEVRDISPIESLRQLSDLYFEVLGKHKLQKTEIFGEHYYAE